MNDVPAIVVRKVGSSADARVDRGRAVRLHAAGGDVLERRGRRPRCPAPARRGCRTPSTTAPSAPRPRTASARGPSARDTPASPRTGRSARPGRRTPASPSSRRSPGRPCRPSGRRAACPAGRSFPTGRPSRCSGRACRPRSASRPTRSRCAACCRPGRRSVTAFAICARVPSPCATGLDRNRFIARIDWSISWTWSASCGRHAAARCALGSGSRNSTRAGDSSSASWKSESWPKYASETRRFCAARLRRGEIVAHARTARPGRAAGTGTPRPDRRP